MRFDPCIGHPKSISRISLLRPSRAKPTPWWENRQDPGLGQADPAMGLAYPRTSAGASPFRSVSRGYGRYIERIRLATATAEQTGSPSRAYRCIEARRIRIGHEPSGLERWQSDIADVSVEVAYRGRSGSPVPGPFGGPKRHRRVRAKASEECQSN
jgi:hypothetical protein